MPVDGRGRERVYVRMKTKSMLILFVFMCSLQFPLVAPGRDLTFLVTSDLHYSTSEPGNAGQLLLNVQTMNGLPGLAYPGGVGGTVGTPRGVLVSGDLTMSASQEDWDLFEASYPLNGGPGAAEINYPVYEIPGNHSYFTYPGGGTRPLPTPVLEEIVGRHGSVLYSWD